MAKLSLLRQFRWKKSLKIDYMPSYVDVINFENEASPNVIRLIKSGEFYRAYNRSAWLFQTCITEHRVMRKYIKALKDDIYYIGFPEKSLFNNIGERKSSKTEFGFDIVLNDDEVPDLSGYDSWKSMVVALHSSKADFNSLPLAGVEAEREVIRRLREFQLENKTMVECAVFLAELRELLSNK